MSSRARLGLALWCCAALSAHALPCPLVEDRERVQPAQLVVAQVRSIRPSADAGFAGWGEAVAEVQVESVLRGPSLPAVRRLRVPVVAGQPAHGLRPGGRHILFVQDDGLLALCGGTRQLAEGETQRAEQLRALQALYRWSPPPADQLFSNRLWAPGDEAELLSVLPRLADHEKLQALQLLARRGHRSAEPSMLQALREARLQQGEDSLGLVAHAVLPLGSQALMDAAVQRLADARSLAPTPTGPRVLGRLDDAALARLALEHANRNLLELIRAVHFAAPARVHVRPELLPPEAVAQFSPEHRKALADMLQHRHGLQQKFERVTPEHWLHFASTGTPEELRSFLARGAQVDWRVQSDTALVAALRASRHDNARLLLEAGADANAADGEGSTPLHLIAREGFAWKQGLADAKLAMARQLLAKGARPSAKGRQGWTPLHHAVAQRFDGMAHLLVDAGADVNAEAEDSPAIDGLRPLQIALDQDNAPLADFLRSRGAVTSPAFSAKRAAHRAAVHLLGPLLRGH